MSTHTEKTQLGEQAGVANGLPAAIRNRHDNHNLNLAIDIRRRQRSVSQSFSR